MITVLSVWILFSTFSFAHDRESILQELNLGNEDVFIKEVKVEDVDSNVETSKYSVILKKSTSFRGNSLARENHLVFNSRDGLMMLKGNDAIFTFDGVKCLASAEFRDNKFCGCTLAKPFRVSKSVSVPKGAKVQFSEGKIRMFRTPRVDPRERKRESASGPVIVGGVTIAPGDTYSIENGKVVRMENPPESFCF